MRTGRSAALWLQRHGLEAVLVAGFIGLLAWFGAVGYGFFPKPPPRPTPTPTPPVGQFDGVSAYQHVLAQTALGPRPTGSQASTQAGDYIVEKLKQAGWRVELQTFSYRGVAARNIIGKAGSGPLVIIGAHYDTRKRADQDPDATRRVQPVLGANDGASGTAVLLELARAIDKTRLSNEVWLAFFDAEDNGGLDGWEFSAGAQHMADSLTIAPEYVVVADMIGDTSQQIYKERNSTPVLQDKIWALAARMGYGAYFIGDYKYAMTDDHTPFLHRGFVAVDIIDFDYPYWHTTQDTPDKVSPESLERVGRVLKALLETQ